MKLLTYSFFLLGLLGAPFLGCGSSGGNKPDAAGGSFITGGVIGTGGVTATGGPSVPYDGGTGTGTGGSIAPIDAGSGGCPKVLDCTALAPAACHDLITNPACLPEGVLAQDPGPDPVPPYPTCAAQ